MGSEATRVTAAAAAAVGESGQDNLGEGELQLLERTLSYQVAGPHRSGLRAPELGA